MFTFEDKGANYINPKTGRPRDCQKICDKLNGLKEKGTPDADMEAKALLRKLCKEDLFFLMYFMLNVKVCNHPWIVDRIHEVEKLNANTLDLWAREHFKSTIITFGLNIQSLLKNAEECIGIISETRQIAKAFLRRIKIELEKNELLKATFDDILYQKPEKQSPKWSEDEGLIIKRKSTLNTASVEGWGIDFLPTGKHFTILNYDDLVDQNTVNTPEQMMKNKYMFKMSDNLGADAIPGQVCTRRIIGTIYHYMDLNQELSESGEWIVRKYPAEDSKGKPVLMTRETLDRKKRSQGSYVYSCQMLLDPVAKEEQKFLIEWISYYRQATQKMNRIILVDPANEKKAQSSYTVMVCLGIDTLNNYYLLDMVRDKFKLNERWESLKDFVNKNQCRFVYYEKNGMGAIDIQYHREKMREEGVFFNIEPISNAGLKKEARIEQLQPLFEAGMIHIPDVLVYYDTEEKRHDLIHEFISEEYLRFPFCTHMDMLDCIASMKNEKVVFYPPKVLGKRENKGYNPFDTTRNDNTSFMSI